MGDAIVVKRRDGSGLPKHTTASEFNAVGISLKKLPGAGVKVCVIWFACF